MAGQSVWGYGILRGRKTMSGFFSIFIPVFRISSSYSIFLPSSLSFFTSSLRFFFWNAAGKQKKKWLTSLFHVLKQPAETAIVPTNRRLPRLLLNRLSTQF